MLITLHHQYELELKNQIVLQIEIIKSKNKKCDARIIKLGFHISLLTVIVILLFLAFDKKKMK